MSNRCGDGHKGQFEHIGAALNFTAGRFLCPCAEAMHQAYVSRPGIFIFMPLDTLRRAVESTQWPIIRIYISSDRNSPLNS